MRDLTGQHALILHRQLSLAGGVQSHNKTHNVHPVVLYMIYGNSGCGIETHTAVVPINHV